MLLLGLGDDDFTAEFLPGSRGKVISPCVSGLGALLFNGSSRGSSVKSFIGGLVFLLKEHWRARWINKDQLVKQWTFFT